MSPLFAERRGLNPAASFLGIWQALLWKLLLACVREHDDSRYDERHRQHLAHRQPITVQVADLRVGLANEFHYSPEYTSRLIKRITGQPFIRLLTSVRLENAEELLRDTTMPVSEIAAAIGYESVEHFIRTFRQRTGMTPSAYRHKKRAPAILPEP